MSKNKVDHVKDFVSAVIQRRSYTAPFIKWSILVIIVFSILAVAFSNALVNTRLDSLKEEIHQRMEVQAGSKSRIIETWLQGLERMGSHIIEGDMVRLFATEVAAQGDNNTELQSQLVAQLPYMRQMIREFTSKFNLQDAFMVNKKGHVYLSGSLKSGMLLTPAQEIGVKAVFASGQTQYLPIRQVGAQYIMEIVKPVFSLDEKKVEVVSAFLIMAPVTGPLSKIMAPSTFDRSGEKGYLLQQVGNRTWHVNFDGPIALTQVDFGGKTLPKGLISSLIDNDNVFASLAPIENTHLVAMYEYDSVEALATARNFKQTIYTFVGLGILTSIAVVLSIVWYLLGQRNRNRVTAQEQAMNALIRTVEIRDPYLSGHHQRVARLAIQISNKLRMPVKDRSTLYYAALLSGIGKIFIPQNILTKPGKLTESERKTMEGHVSHALNILSGIDFEFPISDVIHQMYERADGSGYPNKLNGEEINRLSRVLGVCDVFSALTSPRAYRTRKSEEDAIQMMLDEKGKYDPVILSALKSLHTEKPEKSK